MNFPIPPRSSPVSALLNESRDPLATARAAAPGFTVTILPTHGLVRG